MFSVLYSTACMCLLNLHSRIRVQNSTRLAACSLKKTPKAQNMHTFPQATLCVTNFKGHSTLTFCKELSLKSVGALHVVLLSDLSLSINVALKYALELNSKLHETNRQGINPRAKHPFPHCNCLIPSLLSRKGVIVSSAACYRGMWKHQAQPNNFPTNTKPRYKIQSQITQGGSLNPVWYETSTKSH